MSILRRLASVPWWAWMPLLVVGFAIMVIGAGWFPLFAIALGWALVTLLRRWPPEAENADTSASPDGGVDVNVNVMTGQRQETTETMVARMSDEQLYALWAQTSQDLRHKYLPASILSHAQLREALLEEMTRRHPDVIGRWLADRPDQRDPRTYLGQG
ncbi:hypothetical protein [Phytoactinopolyspora halotolerans]|uniref:Uncharacterized protein n=1 Tax=Phytoactinopolyspora halotolerans TaxID=1981512 RepID=A0A6L9S4G3_9ACTN|nr:hypothetical protein [Phytoactinopolyspora halotolerans]NED99978.1 hypothetical protein [Phytoactinopolyspora halotolerans]